MARITLGGKPINTAGDLPAAGSLAPDFVLLNSRLAEMSLESFSGKRKVLSVLPSLDTPVCAKSARKFNQQAVEYDNLVVLMISKDLPFAQQRFCSGEKLTNLVSLSAFRSDFGQRYGVDMIDGPLRGLLARAVLVLDEGNRVIHSQLIEELSTEPDYNRIIEAL